jgi:hypothetical protein
MAYAIGIQIADESSDGNAILGDVGTMGAIGKAAVSVRLTGMQRESVRFGGQTVRTDSSARASAFTSDADVAAALSIGGVVGAWPGKRVGETRMGGVDLIGSVIVTPNANRGDLEIGGRPVLFGAGVRLGITSETRSLPAMSVTALTRLSRGFSVTAPFLPTDSGQLVRIGLQRGDMSTLEYRFAASKKAGRFNVSSGIGQNLYYITTDYVVEGSGELGSGYETTSFHVSRTAAFVGATYTRNKLTFGAELGRVMGGSQTTLNAFGDRGTAPARSYLSIGVRLPAGRTLDPH